MTSAINGALESLTGLAAFVRAADAGSFVAAGRQLGISASAIGKGIARLEERLGVRLFHRTTRSIALTDEGALLYERAARILQDVAEAEAAVADTRAKPRGRLKVSVPDGLGQFVIAPGLPRFCARYPEVEVELHLGDRLVNVVEESYDVVVRAAASLDDTSLLARRLAPHRFGVCASPAYLERAGVPLVPDDLRRHEAIHFTFANTGRRHPWYFRDGNGAVTETMPPGRLAFSSNAAMVACAVADQGLVYLPSYITAAAVREGRLTAVLEGLVPDRGTIAALWPPSRHPAPKVRGFLEFLEGLLAEACWPERKERKVD